MRIVWFFTGALVLPPTAVAQTVFFADDFDCSDSNSFGDPAGIFGWDAASGDAWQTDSSAGVAPLTDNNAGSFGAPADDYENFLLTGHSLWTDIAVEATMTNTDDDAMGLVVRYASPDSYYACYMTKHQAAACTNAGENVGTRVAIIRVDTNNQTCSDDYTVVTDTDFSYIGDTEYRMRISAVAGTVICTIDVDTDGTLGSAGDLVLSYDDPDPLPSGLAGLYSFDNGETGGLVYDDVVIYGYDPDSDADGLPDAVELVLGTDPQNPDTDHDGISDAHEAGMAQHPPDQEPDSSTDALDTDSDGDGIPDRIEAGDNDPSTPPVDSDCDGIPDVRDVDSDNDGTQDINDLCPTIPGAQIDSDNDRVGDDCDSDDDDNFVCIDRDADGCDDCAVAGIFDPDNDGVDSDGDGICDHGDSSDSDADGIDDQVDNCPATYNPQQEDLDSDLLGDACDKDADGDGLNDDLLMGGAGLTCHSLGGDLSWLTLLVWVIIRRLRRTKTCR